MGTRLWSNCLPNNYLNNTQQQNIWTRTRAFVRESLSDNDIDFAEPMDFGPNGVFLSIVISESALTILGVLHFRRGKWKTQEV